MMLDANSRCKLCDAPIGQTRRGTIRRSSMLLAELDPTGLFCSIRCAIRYAVERFGASR